MSEQRAIVVTGNTTCLSVLCLHAAVGMYACKNQHMYMCGEKCSKGSGKSVLK